MKKLIPITLFMCSVAFLMFACSNNSATNTKTIFGRWKIVDVQNSDTILKIPEKILYVIELNTDSSFSVYIEDNILKGIFSVKANQQIEFKNITVTDVCCNSQLGETIESLFSKSPFQFQLRNDTLLLSNKNEQLSIKFIQQ